MTLRWRCPGCGQRYWLRNSCAPCQERALHQAAMRLFDEAIRRARQEAWN